MSGCDNESVGEGESDCDNHSDCESDCEGGCNGESSSGCCSESDCDSNCESDCENEGESVTDNVVLYRFNEECKECVLSEINKANFAKRFDGKTVKSVRVWLTVMTSAELRDVFYNPRKKIKYYKKKLKVNK